MNKEIKYPEKIIEYDIEKILGIDNEEKDDSVGYYQPFCIILENDKKEQVQLFMDYDRLLSLIFLLKPYLESYEAREKADEEMHKEWEKKNE